MLPAVDVARYLIHLASPVEDEDADCLGHMRLQKLLYYVQAWHLAAYDKQLFTGRIEAWQHGPVLPDIYQEFKQYGCAAIPPAQGSEPGSLSEKDKLFIRHIWEQYKQYSATALRAMTHRDQPWRDAYRSAGAGGRCNEEITPEALREYFAPQLRDRILRANSGINPALWDSTSEAINEGRVRSIEEIRRDLRHRRAGPDAR
jgi:uncharacterized phage-associated protein